MSQPAAPAGGSPFSPRVVLAMVLFGATVFVALLWAIGSGSGGGSINNGQAHAGSKGLTGYAALADLLEARGYSIRRARTEPMLRESGLLILTPPPGAEASELERIITEHRSIGPVMLVLPKWEAIPARYIQPSAKDGWVQIAGVSAPEWAGKLEGLKLKPVESERGSTWDGLGMAGKLPDRRVQSDSPSSLIPLVHGSNGDVLAGFLNDNGYYPDLANEAGYDAGEPGEQTDQTIYPLIVVAEPDLIDNWGLADDRRALLALRLVDAAQDGRRDPVTFDLTLNGFKRSPNLLTLAFRPPFLAATLCLLLAALVAGWRAFRRFGPSLAPARAIAFGKRALIANSAALIRRSGRIHLLATPYASLVRERVARTLALPRHADPGATEQAIDKALAARDPAARPFSAVLSDLRGARRPADLLRAGQALHALERTLAR